MTFNIIIRHVMAGLCLVMVLSSCGGGGNRPSTSSSSSDSVSVSSGTQSSVPPIASSVSSDSSAASSQGDVIGQCLATDFKRPANISLEPIFGEREFTAPTGLVFFPGNDNIAYVHEQRGQIYRLEFQADGSFTESLFVDLTEFYNIYATGFLGFGTELECFECGLFSMAFHPNFDDNGYIYFSFTEGGNNGQVPLVSYIARFRSDDKGMSLASDGGDSLFRENIYTLQQENKSHNNGQVRFGPDGYLYTSFGDGGVEGGRRSQDPSNAFGSILRLTDEGEPAPGNKVENGLPEIFAYGLRNPWSWNFDRETGDLWVGDVGQESVEEIDIVVNGGNYGWPCYQGLQFYRENCGSDGPYVDPVYDYTRTDGRSVTGGYVYRGTAIPDLYGKYVFGDFGSGKVFAIFNNDGENYQRLELVTTSTEISAFAQDSTGELYVVDIQNGNISKIIPPVEDSRPLIPQKLSLTGCVSKSDITLPDESLIEYEINEPLWSDNADKERFMAIPSGEKITIMDDGDLEFPKGTILVKNFLLDGKYIETRLMLSHEKNNWSGYSYQWNSEQTEALLVDGYADVQYGDQVWHYPSQAECFQCHTAAAGYTLGPELKQLNKDIVRDGGTMGNQLTILDQEGVFNRPIVSADYFGALPNSKDETASLEDRGRAYFHSNCSHCHRPGGTTQSSMDWRFTTQWQAVNVCGAEPRQGTFDIVDGKLVVPGDPDASVLWYRVSLLGDNHMPPVGSNVIDPHGAPLIKSWIENARDCGDIGFGSLENHFRIKNRWTGAYISNAGGVVPSTTENSDSLLWKINYVNGFYRIQSVASNDDYLHVMSYPMVSVSQALPGWWSADWEVVANGDYFMFKNRWQNTFLHMMSGFDGGLMMGDVDLGWHSAMWSFEQVESD